MILLALPWPSGHEPLWRSNLSFFFGSSGSVDCHPGSSAGSEGLLPGVYIKVASGPI